MKKTRQNLIIPAAAVAAIALIGTLFYAGCGGGTNQLPYVPQSLAKNCSKKVPMEPPAPAAARSAAQYDTYDYSSYYPEESETSIQCIQLIAAYSYDQQQYTYTSYDQYYPSSVSVPAGSTLYVWAMLYNYTCYVVTPESTFTWDLATSVGSITQNYDFSDVGWTYSSKYPLELIEIAVGSSASSGDLEVSYKDYSDTITISVTGSSSKSVTASVSPTSGTTYDSYTLTCTVSGGTATSLDGRCDSIETFTPITSGNTMSCTYQATGTFTPGCQLDGSITDNVDTSVTVSSY